VTREARAALRREGLSRRDFLHASGALIVSFSAATIVESIGVAQGPFDTRASHVDPAKLDSWIAIAADGTVTAYTGKCELGQGILTAQAQLVAEELCVPLDRVRIVQCDTAVSPDQGTTSGSQSTPANFNERNLAQAAATAREALLGMASTRLGAAVGTLSVANGVITATANPSSRITYAELVGGRRINMTVDARAKRKPSTEWTVLGTAAARVDMAAMATGQFEFVHNVRVPGMLHGAVVRPPAARATLVGVDEQSVAGVAGLVKVVVKHNFVGVVAEKPWQAMQAAARLKATWKDGAALPDQRSFHEYLRRQPSSDGFVVNTGDVDGALAGAANGRVLRATYLHPYQMHGSMGTSCAVADVKDTTVTVWSPTQSAYPTRSGVAMVLGVPLENIRVVFTRGSGCYGINGADTVSYDAAVLSQAVGRPVRVQLSRRDEMAWENYGLACVIDQRVALDADGSGTIKAWDYEAWFPSRGGRPGYDRPGNVVTGMLLGFEPAPFRPRPASQPGAFRNGSNAAPSYVRGHVGGTSGGAGVVAAERVLTIESPFFTGPLRSPSRLQNTFAHECFLDEVAAHVGADPVAYRLKHLSATAQRGDCRGGEKRERRRVRHRKTSGAAARHRARRFAWSTRATTATSRWSRTSGGPGQRAHRRQALLRGPGLRADLNPDGMRNQIEGGAAGPQPRARRGSDVGPDACHVR
jgi:CO/xanthine dehydrogenase Mo-binding subunit